MLRQFLLGLVLVTSALAQQRGPKTLLLQATPRTIEIVVPKLVYSNDALVILVDLGDADPHSVKLELTRSNGEKLSWPPALSPRVDDSMELDGWRMERNEGGFGFFETPKFHGLNASWLSPRSGERLTLTLSAQSRSLPAIVTVSSAAAQLSKFFRIASGLRPLVAGVTSASATLAVNRSNTIQEAILLYAPDEFSTLALRLPNGETLSATATKSKSYGCSWIETSGVGEGPEFGAVVFLGARACVLCRNGIPAGSFLFTASGQPLPTEKVFGFGVARLAGTTVEDLLEDDDPV